MAVAVVTKSPLGGCWFACERGRCSKGESRGGLKGQGSQHVGLGEGRPRRQRLGCVRGRRGAVWLPAVRREE